MPRPQWAAISSIWASRPRRANSSRAEAMIRARLRRASARSGRSVSDIAPALAEGSIDKRNLSSLSSTRQDGTGLPLPLTPLLPGGVMLVITAPTGQIGRQVLEKVLEGDRPVRVIARDPAKLPGPVRERVEVVQGTHSDPAVLSEAFAGADTVFWLVPPNARAESVDGYVLGFTRTACEAITQQGV